MAVTLSSLAGAAAQFFDNNGVPLAGGLIYTYTAGTTTPAATYTSSTGLTAHTNPIVLNAAGRIATGEVWLTSGVDYKFIVQTALFVQLGSYDNIPSVNDFTSIYAALANTSNVALGDALVGFRQSNSAGNLSGAVGRTVHQKLQEFVSVKDFGAVGDGIADDTAAFIAAVNCFSSTGSVFLPNGTYKITSTILCDDKFISFIGTGVSSSVILYSPFAAGIAFDLRHTAANKKAFSFSDMSLMTDVASAGTAIKISVKLTAASIQVNGEDASLFLTNFTVTQTGTGYWTTFLHSLYNGGMHFNTVSFDNTIATAQANPNVFGILVENTDTRVSTIGTIIASDLLIYRTAVAINLIGNNVTQIETIDIVIGGIVGVSDAAIKVIGKAGAFGIVNVHFDCQQYVIDSRLGNLLIGHFIGCDFRKGSNGGPVINSAMFAIDAGETISFSGCQMTGRNSVSSSTVNKTFLFSNTQIGRAIYRTSISGCTFRNFYYVFGLSLNSIINTAGNIYNGIEGYVLEDDSLDGSIALRDGMVSKTLVVSLDNTGTATVAIAVPRGYYGQRWPVALLQANTGTGLDLLVCQYDFGASTDTSCVFIVQGNTTTRLVRFSFIAMGTFQIPVDDV